MFCSNCGNKLPNDASFCNNCGTAVGQAPSDTSSQQSQQARNQQPNPTASVDFEALKARGKGFVNKALGDDFQSTTSEPTYEKHPHPYHALGGWLAVFAYAQPIIFGLLIIANLAGIFAMFPLLRWISGFMATRIVFAMIIYLICFAAIAFLSIKFFLMVRSKDARFFRYYEVALILSVGMYIVVHTILPGINALFFFRDILSSGVGIAIWILYFSKSVRVRTYFGSDEYLRRSIFLKNVPSPVPADMQPYVPPQPYQAPPSNTQQTQQTTYQPPVAPVSTNEETVTSGSEPEKAFCGQCGKAVSPQASFCSSCGTARTNTDV